MNLFSEMESNSAHFLLQAHHHIGAVFVTLRLISTVLFGPALPFHRWQSGSTFVEFDAATEFVVFICSLGNLLIQLRANMKIQIENEKTSMLA